MTSFKINSLDLIFILNFLVLNKYIYRKGHNTMQYEKEITKQI